MMVKGPAARIGPPVPTYSGQLVKVTGEGEHVTIAFTADTPAELEDRLACIGVAVRQRMLANNAAVLEAGGHFEERQRQVYAAAVAQLRREVGRESPPAEEDAIRADDPAGAVHAAENP